MNVKTKNLIGGILLATTFAATYTAVSSDDTRQGSNQGSNYVKAKGDYGMGRGMGPCGHGGQGGGPDCITEGGEGYGRAYGRAGQGYGRGGQNYGQGGQGYGGGRGQGQGQGKGQQQQYRYRDGSGQGMGQGQGMNQQRSAPQGAPQSEIPSAPVMQ